MIERLAPGVYVTEVAFEAKTIEGVTTSTADLADANGGAGSRRTSATQAPAWTDTNQGDPGVTLLELLSWPDAAALYRTALGDGVASGLSIGADSGSAGLSVTPGEALGADGRPVKARIETARRLTDPDS